MIVAMTRGRRGCAALAAIATIAVVGCTRSPETLPQHHGKSSAAILTELGPPATATTFTMAECVGELRVQLFNVYPLDRPGNAEVHIEERTWHDGSYRITLWLHKVQDEWRVLDSCRWHRDTHF
jgi:hypothetical protein